MEATISRLLEEVKRELARLYGDHLVKVILYGSHARGEASVHSDVDVMVVLRGEVEDIAEAKRLADLGVHLLETYHELVAFMPVPEEEYADPLHPLMMNVHQEGIEL